MKRSAPMRRTAFKPKGWTPKPAKQIDYAPRPRACAVRINDGKARMVVPVPKSDPVRDESYRRWIASLPCINCGQVGMSQAAHGPSLGRGIKADDRTCVPLCADAYGGQGCHSKADQYILFDRSERVRKFREWAEKVQALWEAKEDKP